MLSRLLDLVDDPSSRDEFSSFGVCALERSYRKISLIVCLLFVMVASAGCAVTGPSRSQVPNRLVEGSASVQTKPPRPDSPLSSVKFANHYFTDDSGTDKRPAELMEVSVESLIAEADTAVDVETLPLPFVPEPIPLVEEIGIYVIEVGDRVDLKFLNRPELNETLLVGDDGVITPAITPAVYAAGQTVSMLKEELSRLLLARRYDPVASRSDNMSVDYRIAVDDLIELRFSVIGELSDTVAVRPDGKISLARIGEVIAQGKTPIELQHELEERYAVEVKQPQLVVIMRKTTSPEVYVDGIAVPLPIKGISDFSVSVTKLAPRLIYVMGEVNRPSAVPFQPSMTAIRAIGTSGGTKRTANLKHVIILRNNSRTGTQEIAVDLRCRRRHSWGTSSHTDGGFSDVDLMPNDVILIPKTKIAKVQDWLDQYVYNLFPPLRNSSAFTVLYNNGIPGLNAVP